MDSCGSKGRLWAKMCSKALICVFEASLHGQVCSLIEDYYLFLIEEFALMWASDSLYSVRNPNLIVLGWSRLQKAVIRPDTN